MVVLKPWTMTTSGLKSWMLTRSHLDKDRSFFEHIILRAFLIDIDDKDLLWVAAVCLPLLAEKIPKRMHSYYSTHSWVSILAFLFGTARWTWFPFCSDDPACNFLKTFSMTTGTSGLFRVLAFPNFHLRVYLCHGASWTLWSGTPIGTDSDSHSKSYQKPIPLVLRAHWQDFLLPFGRNNEEPTWWLRYCWVGKPSWSPFQILYRPEAPDHGFSWRTICHCCPSDGDDQKCIYTPRQCHSSICFDWTTWTLCTYWPDFVPRYCTMALQWTWWIPSSWRLWTFSPSAIF